MSILPPKYFYSKKKIEMHLLTLYRIPLEPNSNITEFVSTWPCACAAVVVFRYLFPDVC